MLQDMTAITLRYKYSTDFKFNGMTKRIVCHPNKIISSQSLIFKENNEIYGFKLYLCLCNIFVQFYLGDTP